MPAQRFVEALQQQIGNEFAASQQYIANAIYYDTATLPRLAAFFYRQAVEERNHAMMMVQYLLDTDNDVALPSLDAPQQSFDDHVAPVRLALEQERKVSEQIADLAKIAREEGDFLSEHYVQWFLKEQVEEVASMSDLQNVMERTRENPMMAEEFLSREAFGEEPDDPTAPAAAGGAL